MKSVLTTIITCLLLSPTVTLARERQRKSSASPKTFFLAKSETTDNQQKPLDFSGTGRPGQQTAGESRGNCGNTSGFEALIPISKSGKTVSGHPRFWVYFPEPLPAQSQVEFVIQNEAREDIWRSRTAVDIQSGYQSFSLPATAVPLEVGQWHRWYVKVYCDSQIASTQYIQGWVNRVPLNSQLHLELLDNPQSSHLIYGHHRIWYDAIDQLLSNYQHNSPNLNLEQDWQSLLGARGVDLDQLPSIGGRYEAVEPTHLEHPY